MSFLFSFSSPATSSDNYCVESTCDVANAYNATQRNNVSSDVMKNNTVRYDDSNVVGKYHTIDLNEWEEIDNHVIDNNRIGVGRAYGMMDATVLIQVGKEGRTDTCENYAMYHKKDWYEYRKERGIKKYKEPIISDNGVIWVGNTQNVYNFKVFVPVVKSE